MTSPSKRSATNIASSPPNISLIGDNNILVDSTEIINLCRKHNSQILTVLNELLQAKTDVTELMRTTQTIQRVLGRCVNDYGSLENIQLKTVETVYISICEYEKKIQQLQGKGALVRFITQSRLRGKIDQLSNNICIQVETMEREIKELLVKQFVVDNSDEFTELLEQIDADFAEKNKAIIQLRKSGSDLRKSLDAEKMIQDKETREKLENALNIVKEPKKREELFKNIPKLAVKPVSSEDPVCNVVSAFLNDETEKVVGDVVFARSTSTYPVIKITGKREGDPICDTYCLSHFENRTIAAVADGCGWGVEPKEASRKASQMFVAFIKRQQHLIQKTDDAASIILRAYWAAHRSIVEGRTPETLFMAGTTTMIAGIVLELARPENGKSFAFVFGSIGDCKAYHWAPNATITEITRGNRGNHDMKDPGGRIGPYGDNGSPDLRNLTLYCYLCNDGDIISLVSDGIHDNLDPKIMGKKPSEINLSVPDEDWDKMTPDDDQKTFTWIEGFLNKMVAKPISVASLSRSLIDHAVTQTVKMRNFMEENPGKKVVADYSILPGKLDHVTALTFKVGIKRKSWTTSSAPTNSPREVERKTVSGNNAQSIPRSSKEFDVFWKQDSALGARGMSFQEGSLLVDADDARSDPHAMIWDRHFGEVFVKEWKEFINGLGLKLSPEEENQLRTIIDYSKTGSVTRYKFQEFLKGFGPLESCVQNVKRVVAAEWFHGFISANESKKFLEQQPVGSFLIRFSGSRPGSFVLDYVREVGHVRSVRLYGHPGGGFAAASEGGQAKELLFKTLHDLVEMYTKMSVLTMPFSTALTHKSWFFGDVTSEEAEQLLAGQPLGTFLIRFSNQGFLAASFVGGGGKVLKGLITKGNFGYQVNNQGMNFQTLDELIQHYQEQKIFSLPYQQ